MESFADWVAREITDRGWTIPEAARRSKRGGYKGLSASMIYKVINDQAKPGLDFYTGIARAFDLLPEFVFRKAGLLSPDPPESVTSRELIYLFLQLDPDDQQRMLQIARTFVEAKKKPPIIGEEEATTGA